MNITINGEKEHLTGQTIVISDLLQIKNVESPEMVSVQLNGKIVNQERFQSTSVTENDELEFLYFMGGGENK